MDDLDTRAREAAHAAVDRHVTALYQAHALSLARLALLMLGDRDAAQDVVQDAFLGLYRRWDKLASADAAPAYLRASVLNGCRTLLKSRSRPALRAAEESLESAEAAMMHTEEQRAMLAAIRRLPARQPRAVPRDSWTRWLRTWQGPAVAAAVVVLVAASLVTLKSLRNEAAPAPAPVASLGSIAGPGSAAGTTPRYYVSMGWAGNAGSWAIIVGDEQAGKTIATFPLAKGGSLASAAASGAADDRTFVVSADTTQRLAGSPTWYLVRISPGSVNPVRITTLPIEFPAGEGVQGIALSGDRTELAVVASASATEGAPLTLQVYSVATGRQQHSWSTGLRESAGNPKPVSDLSWVGDSTLGFAVTYSPEVREQVRTLDVSDTGTNLMADSRLVWSQYVPAAPHGTRAALHACDTPFLTGDGQAVVCGNFTKSPGDRLSVVWLAYPLTTPTRPRLIGLIGSIEEPPDVSNFNGPISVEWTNPSGTEVIGAWNTSVGVKRATEVTNYAGVIENGKVKPFPVVAGPSVAW